MSLLKETKVSSKRIFKGKLLDVRKDEVILPNNKIGYREWIKHPGASCCIPILKNNKIIMVKQYRYAVGEESIELPAGKIDINETSQGCASRELEEETGYKANKLTLLTMFYPAIGMANEKIWIYLAQDLEKSKASLDEDEFVEKMIVDQKTAIDMVKRGIIKDSKSIIGLIWLDKYLKGEWKPNIT